MGTILVLLAVLVWIVVLGVPVLAFVRASRALREVAALREEFRRAADTAAAARRPPAAGERPVTERHVAPPETTTAPSAAPLHVPGPPLHPAPAAPLSAPPAAPRPGAPGARPVMAPPGPLETTERAPAVPEPPSLEAQIGGRWLLYLGVGALIVAVAFFVKLAFESGWVTEGMRVIIGALAGTALVMAGRRFARSGYALYGQALAGGGLAILDLSIYAAFNFYALIGKPVAFFLMVLVTVLAAWLADRERSQGLAFLAVGGGFVTPFLVGGETGSQTALFGYDATLVAGTAYLARRRDWALLNLLGYVLVVLTVAGWFVRFYRDATYLRTFSFLSLFCALFADILARTRRSSHREAQAVAVVLATAPLFYYAVSLAILFPHTAALLVVLVLWTAVGLALARRAGSPAGRLVAWVAAMVPLLAWAGGRASAAWFSAGLAVSGAIFLLHVLALVDTLDVGGQRLPAVEVVRVHAAGLGLYAALHLLSRSSPQLSPALAAAGVSLAQLVVAAVVRRRSPEAALHAGVVASTLAAVAAAHGTGGSWGTIGVAVEAAGITAAGLWTGREWVRLGGGFLLSLATLRQAGLAFEPVSTSHVVLANARTAAAAILMGLLGWLARLHRRASDERPLPVREDSDYFLLALHAVLFVTLTAEINAFWELRRVGGRPAALSREASLLTAWALQAAGIIRVGLTRHRDRLRFAGGLLLAVPALRLLASLWGSVLAREVPPAGYVVGVNARAAAALVTAGVLAWVAVAHRRASEALSAGGRRAVSAAVLTATLVVLGWLSAETSAFWYLRDAAGGDPRRVFHFARELTLSLLWSTSAAGLVAAGLRRDYAPVRYLAIVLFFVTVAKVALVDLSELERLYRVLSVAALGFLLLAASFLYQRARAGHA